MTVCCYKSINGMCILWGNFVHYWYPLVHVRGSWIKTVSFRGQATQLVHCFYLCTSFFGYLQCQWWSKDNKKIDQPYDNPLILLRCTRDVLINITSLDLLGRIPQHYPGIAHRTILNHCELHYALSISIPSAPFFSRFLSDTYQLIWVLCAGETV